MTDEKRRKIKERLEMLALLREQKVLNLPEAAIYMNVSVGWLYRATSKRLVPHSKPNNKTIYFEREMLDKWLLRNRRPTIEEIESTHK